MVAVDDEMIIGFGDIDETGYLDRLFVHSDYQRKGDVTAICNQLEQTGQGIIVTYASNLVSQTVTRDFSRKRYLFRLFGRL